jgi:hypothetical protein
MSEAPDTCAVCQMAAQMIPLGRTDCVGIDCPRCGRYVWFATFTADAVTSGRVSDQHARKAVSAWIQEQNLLGANPLLDNSLVERAIAVAEPGLIERSRRLLLECGRRTQFYDQNVHDPMLPLAAITWSEDETEVQSLADLLREQGLLKKGAAAEFRLTALGLTEVEAKQRQLVTDQVFVAMSFDPAMKSVYDNGLYAGIKGAGYKPFRVDRYDHVNRIDDEIIAQIRRSRFLVADFTGQKHGVYFEAGFALGLAREVIWSCRRDDIKNLHFDIRQYNCIDWTTESELAERLKLRIEAVMGRGPNP